MRCRNSEIKEDSISHDPLQHGNASTDLPLQRDGPKDNESENDCIEDEGEKGAVSSARAGQHKVSSEEPNLGTHRRKTNLLALPSFPTTRQPLRSRRSPIIGGRPNAEGDAPSQLENAGENEESAYGEFD